MGNTVKIKDLTEFGKMVSDKVKKQKNKMEMKDLAELLGYSPPSLSRFLRLERHVPRRVITKIIEILEFTQEEGERLKELAEERPVAVRPVRPPLNRAMSRPSVRRFGELSFRRIVELIGQLGWAVAYCEADDDISYDLKIYHPDEEEAFALLNFIKARQDDPNAILRAVRAQAVNEPGVVRILYFEPFSNSMMLQETQQADLFDEKETPNVDAWLNRESEGLGRLVHGGNLVRVLAEKLKPTDAVADYLNKADS